MPLKTKGYCFHQQLHSDAESAAMPAMNKLNPLRVELKPSHRFAALLVAAACGSPLLPSLGAGIDVRSGGVGNMQELGIMEALKLKRQVLLSAAEVADLFGVDPKTVTRWAKAGKLTSIRTLGGHRRYRKSEVDELRANYFKSNS